MAVNNLVQPLITEKTMRLAESSQFTFLVQPQATQANIKQEIEQLFTVNVISIRLYHLPQKTRRSGRKRLPVVGSYRKKAVITLKPGQTIEYFQAPDQKKSKKSKKTAKDKSTSSQQPDQKPTAKQKRRSLKSLFTRQKAV